MGRLAQQVDPAIMARATGRCECIGSCGNLHDGHEHGPDDGSSLRADDGRAASGRCPWFDGDAINTLIENRMCVTVYARCSDATCVDRYHLVALCDSCHPERKPAGG